MVYKAINTITEEALDVCARVEVNSSFEKF
jgi:hypothetical protein